MNLFQAYHHSNELVGWLSCLKTLFIFFVFFLFLISSLWLSGWAAHKPFDLGFLRFSNIFKAFDRSLFGIFTNHLCGRLKHLRQFTFTTECLFTSWSFNYIIWGTTITITITNTITILFLRADDQRGFSDKVLDSWEEGEGADLFNFRSKLQNVT